MPEPPTGIVTFLFTDIEGSTKLWERCPNAMRLALARHDAILREVIEKHNGYVFKTIGDAFCAAFPSPPDALNAALNAHLTLTEQEWGDTGPIRIRIGLHSGEAEARDGDYFGPTLNRVARLKALAYGQQTLISEATYEKVCDHLPEGAVLSDMELHRLRDLAAPEHIWQLLHPSLPAEFPPLKSLDYLPTNLPRQMTSFIGRVREMQEVKRLLNSGSLVTLAGTGGTGKTRLALQLGADVLDEYEDGVWLAELAPLADPTLVPAAVAGILDIQEEPGQTTTQTLIEALKPRKMLLLLDNCEHVLNAAASLANALLTHCPDIKILASSREGLGISGEHTYRIPSLSLPPVVGQIEVQDRSELLKYEAVRLFADRAVHVKPDFVVTDHNALFVARICCRLDGIPFALELAASRVRSLPVEQIEGRLHDRFRLLTGGSRTALPRQQTLKALIDWSYDLLNTTEQKFLPRLSVFVGGWALESAERVCAGKGVEPWDMLDLLTALVDKSLVVYEEQEGQAHYRLLETVRQYARDRLMESGEAEVWRTAHRDDFLRMAESAQEQLKGPEQRRWLNTLESEHDNLRAALDFCLDAPEGAEIGLRIAGALQQFWWTRGYLTEGRDRLMAALNQSGAGEPTKARAVALNGAGSLAWMQGDYAAARSLYEESLALGRRLGDKRLVASTLGNLGGVLNQQGDYSAARMLLEESLTMKKESGERQSIANTLIGLGNIAMEQGDYAAARSLSRESLALGRELGDRRGIARSLTNLGNVALEQADYNEALSYYKEGVAIQRELGDERGISRSLNNLGRVAFEQGDHAGARSLYEESLEMARKLGDKQGVAYSLCNLGPLLGKLGEYPAAQECWKECLSQFQELCDRRGAAYALEGCADLAHRRQRLERAARLYGAAHALREEIGSPLPPNECEEHANRQAELEALLDLDTYSAAFTAGQSLSFEQALSCALEGFADAYSFQKGNKD